MAKNLLHLIPIFLFSLFWTIWAGSADSFPTVSVNDFYTLKTGIISAFFIATGFVFIISHQRLFNIKYLILITVFWIVISGISVFFENFILEVITGILAGLTGGHLIRKTTEDSQIKANFIIAALLPGIASGYVWNIAVSTLNIQHFVLPFPALFILIFLFLQHKKSLIHSQAVHQEHHHTSKRLFITGLVISSVLCWILLSFFYWHIIIPKYVDDIFLWVMIPLICLIMTIFSAWINVSEKMGLGFLFALSIIASVATGMFYTLNEWLFIVLFSVSITLIYKIFLGEKSIKTIRVWTGYALVSSAFLLLIMSINADNYAAHAKEIKIPDALIQLAVIQSLMKDITLGPGALVLIFGSLFLYRRNWNFLKI